jgi:hypothetical protein
MAIDTIKSTAVLDGAIATADLANDIAINTSGAITTTGAFTSQGIDDNSNATAITIDSSENVLIGNTDATPYDRTSGNAIAMGDGLISSAQSGGNAAIFNRMTSDGSIVGFRKGGVAVGSIDVDNGDNLTVQGKSDHSGLQFGTNAIFPHKNSANIDATIDLGEGSLRWKDIYLSGGVYLGGTAAANKIDDYEEGTWTPVLYPSPSSVVYGTAAGTYTKVGNTVTCNWMLVLTNKGTLGASVRISGLPFTGLGAPSYQVATFMSSNLDLDANERLTGMQYSGNQFIYLMVEQNDAALYQPSGTGFLNNDSQIHGSITYMTAQ